MLAKYFIQITQLSPGGRGDKVINKPKGLWEVRPSCHLFLGTNQEEWSFLQQEADPRIQATGTGNSSKK